MQSEFTKNALAFGGWNENTFRVQYSLTFNMLSAPIINVLKYISESNIDETKFGITKTLLYLNGFSRTFPYPNAQTCLISRVMRHKFRAGDKPSPTMNDQVLNDTYRVGVYAALTVEQLYEVLEDAKEKGEQMVWTAKQKECFDIIVDQLIKGWDFDDELRVSIKELDEVQDEQCKLDNEKTQGSAGKNYHRAKAGCGGSGGYEIVYTKSDRPETDYNVNKWPNSLKRRLVGCPLRMPKKAMVIEARVELVNVADAKV